ncbi:MAG TPA: DUF6448 family protein [Anaerolineales bacterium]|nr:DUF6448 family protein [Anaerolineales bacterium]
MFKSKFSKRTGLAIAGVLLAGVIFSALATPRPAQAHCDSEQGPVANAAHQALEKGDIKLILPYVQADAEKELTAAFKETQAVRKAGGKTMELADQFFIETAIRLHRAGEGAAYNGVTDETTPEAILVADKAMASGSLDETYKMLDQIIQKGVQEKYEAVVKAREEATHLGTVEAHRERVEAELMFEKYIYELSTLAAAAVPPAEGHNH